MSARKPFKSEVWAAKSLIVSCPTEILISPTAHHRPECPMGSSIRRTAAYGCGLGAKQAARHFSGAVLPEELSFVDRRHIDIANLRAGSADLQNLFLGFDLTKLWGRGESLHAGAPKSTIRVHRRTHATDDPR
jgi:hypothetical protein